MDLNTTFKTDKANYIDARAAYREICKMSEVSRDEAVMLRPQRFEAHKKMVECAENLLMSVQGLYRTHLNAIGLWEMYENMANGKGDVVTMLKIADETAKL